jgi:GAF domain-containing protein
MGVTLPPHDANDEAVRLRALYRYDVLDTTSDTSFERIVELTADALGVPVAVVNLIDRERQWSKACYGLTCTEMPREESFCAWTILSKEVMVVEDATRDPRFASNPLVTGEPYIRLYAGAPLITPDGQIIGSLCVTDSTPRAFGERERRILRHLAALVVDELELRLRARELLRARDHADALIDVSRLAETDVGPLVMAARAVARIAKSLQVDWGGLVAFHPDRAELMPVWTSAGVPGMFERSIHVPRGAGEGLSGHISGLRAVEYVDDYAAHPFALPSLIQAGVRAAAWGNLGDVDGVPYAVAVARTHDGDGWTDAQRTLFEAAARSVSVALERHAHLRSLERAALHDTLTGLRNRRAFDLDLEALLGHATAVGGSFAVGIVDLDGLKCVNDREGHERGDELLRAFAGALTGELRLPPCTRPSPAAWIRPPTSSARTASG